ncbi:MAG TPA: NAD-dependent succinate-semialdehyde dehydrogenase, partial [Solirubrobacteraceae bacterium]|nr:NAD-dependent succinate-semialdehyde dehydrogenase [Solirubrobacteraceae bacterium]
MNEQQVLDNVPKELFIAGAWRAADSGARLEVEDPATGQPLCEIADAGEADALAALTAAADAQAEWGKHPPRERGEILRRAFEMIAERTEELAMLMSLEMGKSVVEARGEVAYANDFLRWFSEEAVRIRGSYSVSPNGKARLLTMRQPVGPCLLITPWNFPLAMGTRKIGPAVAAGCTMVVKPAKQTPLSMLALGKIFEEAGLPPGVLNIVTTSRSGAVTDPLFDDARLRKLSFTGSTEVGRALSKRAMDQLLRVSMELGGNAALLVFEDADLELAIDQAMMAKLRNMGEACTSANRLYVAAPVADEFARRMAQRMEQLRLGRGTEPDTDLGPLIDETQRTKVHELVTDAVDRGATVLTGGGPVDGPGYFYRPTVLTHLAAGSRVLREEIFGPVAPIVSFETEEEAIAKANATEYGLIGYVFTRDLDRALRVAEALDTGMVGLNQGVASNAAAPFGGVKQSGFGREGGAEGID